MLAWHLTHGTSSGRFSLMWSHGCYIRLTAPLLCIYRRLHELPLGMHFPWIRNTWVGTSPFAGIPQTGAALSLPCRAHPVVLLPQLQPFQQDRLTPITFVSKCQTAAPFCRLHSVVSHLARAVLRRRFFTLLPTVRFKTVCR